MHGSSVKLLFLVILPMAVGGMKVVQDYNERCSRRFVCNEAKGLVCLNRVCACATDYTYSNNSKTCLRVASHFVNSCEEDVQCYPSFDTYSKCLNGECTTRNDDANYKGQIPTYTSGGMKVVQDYNERCSRRFVCNEAKGLVCLNRVCACATDYTYSNNSKTYLTVASHLVNSCEEDVQCYPSFDPYSKCLNGECTTRNDDANYKGQIPTYTPDSLNTGRNASISNFKVLGIVLLFYFIFIQ